MYDISSDICLNDKARQPNTNKEGLCYFDEERYVKVLVVSHKLNRDQRFFFIKKNKQTKF